MSIALVIQNGNLSLSTTSMLTNVNNVECHNELVVNGELWHNKLGHPYVKFVKNVE